MRDNSRRVAMDSKRKANGNAAAAEELDDRAAKRRKPDLDLSNGETAETTTQLGLNFIEQVKRTADKTGRLVSTNFLTLPSKKELPDYYKVIKMPIAIDTIESKLTRREFPTLTTLESYFKRMVSNAKDYNQKGSEIYDDAERIRKALSNYMTKHNPAYKTPGYVAFPTPLPGEGDDTDEDEEDDAEGSDEDAEGEIDVEVPAAPLLKRRPGRPPKNAVSQVVQQQRSSATPAVSESQYAGVSYAGLSFQQAQEKIISDMIRHAPDDDEEFRIFEPFINLPPRSLKDYYQVIPHPVSLKGLQKLVRGIHGRNDSPGVSDFKSWKAFENEISYIWQNAWHYNEDGSEISVLAKQLEKFFYERLTEAKQAVPEPTQPKLKIKMSSAAEPPPKITLRMGNKASPAESPAPSAALNGNGDKGRNTFRGSQSVSSVPTPSQLDRARSTSDSVASPTSSTAALVKNEDASKQSPVIQPTNSSLVPNGQATLPHSGGAQVNGSSTPAAPMGALPTPPNLNPYLQGTSLYNGQTYHPPNPSYESKWRQPGKDATDAMITNLSLATHPGLNISKHFRMDLPPSDTMAQQSITINLPHTHYYLQIKPTIAPQLLERQHKLFVTSGTQRLHAMPNLPGQSVDPRHPLFEARLLPGVNRIEVELIAAVPKGAAKAINGQDVELEKITVFANLLRS